MLPTKRFKRASVERLSGHGGVHAVAAARRHGVSVLFTLSGGHVFPLYDAAVKVTGAEPPMRLIDVRHEQTAVFAAEATARLTRSPGLAVVTAGRRDQHRQRGDDRVVQRRAGGGAGRPRPDYRWGTGSLQEIDHPPLLARSPSAPGPSTPRRKWGLPSTRPSGWRSARTAARCSSTSRSRRSTARPRRTWRQLSLSLPGARRRGRRPDRRPAAGGQAAGPGAGV